MIARYPTVQCGQWFQAASSAGQRADRGRWYGNGDDAKGPDVLTDYIRAAMHRATYKILEDGTCIGRIPECPGVFANESTLEACRDELESVLEDWILLGVRLGHQLPVVDDTDLNSPVAT